MRQNARTRRKCVKMRAHAENAQIIRLDRLAGIPPCVFRGLLTVLTVGHSTDSNLAEGADQQWRPTRGDFAELLRHSVSETRCGHILAAQPAAELTTYTVHSDCQLVTLCIGLRIGRLAWHFNCCCASLAAFFAVPRAIEL